MNKLENLTPKTFKTAFLVIRDDVEKTLADWEDHLKGHRNHLGREYTRGMIAKYAQQKKYGFSYKKYPDLPGEVWKRVKDSETKQGYWQISDNNRIKYITNFAENVISGDRLGLTSQGYPKINVNGKKWKCHVLVFSTFFPDEYANRKLDELVLHEDDDKMDFRPHKLRLGTQSDNMKDAHNNGCYEGAKSERMKCASYINGVFEKEYESQSDACRYLKQIGLKKSICSSIGQALHAYKEGKNIKRYGRTWVLL
jgi:hypothetical protein